MPESWLEDIELARELREKFLKSDPESPLTKEDRKRLISLRYFPPDPDYKVKAIFTKYEQSRDIELKTSLGNTKLHRVEGELKFTIHGKQFTIIALDSPKGLFAPFRDLTNGKDTFLLGRYLDIELPASSSKVTLDFNLAYNPDCAFNKNIESLLPPDENTLDIEIRAGEMDYTKAIFK